MLDDPSLAILAMLGLLVVRSQRANLHAAQPTPTTDSLTWNIDEIVGVAIHEMPTEIPLRTQSPSAPWNRTEELIRGM